MVSVSPFLISLHTKAAKSSWVPSSDVRVAGDVDDLQE